MGSCYLSFRSSTCAITNTVARRSLVSEGNGSKHLWFKSGSSESLFLSLSLSLSLSLFLPLTRSPTHSCSAPLSSPVTGPTMVSILGLFVALLTTALIPVDIFLVSSYKAPDGTYHVRE